MERLQKFLSSAGVASRRKAEDLIASGRVKVNGVTVSLPGSRVDVGRDQVEVDGLRVQPASEHVYILLHKPKGYVSTVSDPHASRSVLDLVGVERRIYPVGRLDMASEGLLLLTDDGALTQRLTHPRFGHVKEDQILVRGVPDAASVDRLRAGVELEDGPTSPAVVELIRSEPKGSWFRVVIHEGRKRQIRRMCEAVGFPVLRLIRVRLGPLQIGDLASGKWRYLSDSEKLALRQAAGL